MTRDAGRAISVSRIGPTMALVLSLLLAPATTPVTQAQGLDDRIAQARQRQASLQRSMERQRQQLAELRMDETVADAALDSTAKSLNGINADQAAVRREIADATDALARVRGRRDTLADELRQLDWTLALVAQQIADGDEQLDGRRRMLGARLVEAYRSQNTSLLEQVLDDGSFTDVLTAANAYLAYGDQDAQLAQDIADDQRTLDALRTVALTTRYRTDRLRRDSQGVAEDLRRQQDRLAKAKEKLLVLETRTKDIQDQQRATFQRIAGNQRQTQALVARHAAAERLLDRRIASLVAEAQRRAEARERARREAAARAAAAARRDQRTASRDTRPGSSGTAEGRGRFSWPVSGVVTQEYGCTGFYLEPRRGSCAHFHDGIDISGAPGTPIRAADDGAVAFVGWNPYDADPAFLVVLGHSGGYETAYAHLQGRAVVRAGQFVKRGQVIGYLGDTGNSTGPHLHWEVRRNGVDVDPRSVV